MTIKVLDNGQMALSCFVYLLAVMYSFVLIEDNSSIITGVVGKIGSDILNRQVHKLHSALHSFYFRDGPCGMGDMIQRLTT